MAFVDTLGARFLGLVRYPDALAALLFRAVWALWRDRDLGQRAFVRQVTQQVYFTGVQAITPVMVLALTVGSVSVIQGVSGMGVVADPEDFGRLVTVVVLRDLAPLLTSGVVIVRSVTAVAAELALMKVQREVEALDVMGVSSFRYLVAPRLIGGIIAYFGLSVAFNTAALGGGLFVGSLLLDIPSGELLAASLGAVKPIEIIAFGVRVVLGGGSMFLIACFHGLAVGRSQTEIPPAVSRASIHALVLVVMLQGGVSALLVLRAPPPILDVFQGVL